MASLYLLFLLLPVLANAEITDDMLSFLKSEEQILQNKDIIDITHKYTSGMPTFFGGPHGTHDIYTPVTQISKGNSSNTGVFTLTTHLGTHVDAPGHFNQTLMDEGYDVDHLDLKTLNGPVLVVDAPRDQNITAEALQSLNIPRGVRRVLFRTLNTDRELMYKSQFDGSYTGFTVDGAKYLVQNTDIKLIGIDYLSIAISTFNDLVGVHDVILNTKDIIPVEALKLDDAVPGVYNIHCLPIRLVHGDGAPVRCILIK